MSAGAAGRGSTAPGGGGPTTGRRALPGLALALCLPAAGCAARPLSRPLPIEESPPPGGAEVLGVLELDGGALGGDGLSGLDVAPGADGRLRLTAIGDRGTWCTAELLLDPRGAPLALRDPRVGRLRGADDRPLAGMFRADAESLARLPASQGGGWLVGFERWHRILRYATIDGPGRLVEAPPGLEQAPGNGGLESLGVLADGRWLAIAEQLPADGDPALRTGWIGGPGRWAALRYRPAPGFEPTDLAPLPDGGALVLERRFQLPFGLTGRLARLRPAALAAGALLEPEALLQLAPPLPTDNWEGASAFRHGGRLLAALVSDDNGLPIQRSLLMVVALEA